MWSDSDGKKELSEMPRGRYNSSSEIAVMNEEAVTGPIDNLPTISQLNVSQKSKVHIGTKITSVTQNVHNAEMVKTRFLGLEVISVNKALRCSIAVFVCWTLVVGVGLALYLFKYTLPKTQTRLDLDLSLPCYVWHIIKSTSRVERLWCLAAVSVIMVSLALIIYFTKSPEPVEDIAPHEWNITRDMWLAKKMSESENTSFKPLRLVIIQHTVSQDCYLFVSCAAEMRNLQDWHRQDSRSDIAYNFLIGNDGRVYEGRGWDKVGAHTKYYNRCSLGIGFVGDYRDELPAHSTLTELQINRTMTLLNYGVKMGYLDPNYHVIGAKDIQVTASPGSNIYNVIRKWDNYGNASLYNNRTCEQIYEKVN